MHQKKFIADGECELPDPIYTYNEDPQNFKVTYFDNGDPSLQADLHSQWQTFNRNDPATRQTLKIWVRPTHELLQLMVDHLLPPGLAPGRYRIETFIPGKHATTRQATFMIAVELKGNEMGESYLDERLVIVDMYELFDVWKSLGEYYLDPNQHPEIGRVRQFDITREDPIEEISFGPVRWMPLPELSSSNTRYDSPVGSEDERRGPFPTGNFIFGKYPLWAGEWFDVNPFLKWYSYGYHTGSDLNLPGSSAADKGKPIYAIGDGLVTYAGKAGTWGSIVVIEHPDALVTLPDGQVSQQIVYSRYGHVESEIPVRAGQTVSRGQLVGHIGLAANSSAGWHLHFDICYTDLLKKRPAYWPDLAPLRSLSGSTRNSRAYQSAQASIMRHVMAHFVDPFQFLQDNHIREI